MGLNNVNLEKLGETIAGFQADLATAKRKQRVEGVWNLTPGQPQFSARLPIAGGEFVLEADQPPFLGGGGSRPGPIQYAVFGLAACYTATFATVAASQPKKKTKKAERAPEQPEGKAKKVKQSRRPAIVDEDLDYEELDV